MNRFIYWIAATAVALLVMTLFGGHAHAQAPTPLVEHPVPGKPLNVAVEAPGRVWFTMPDANAIGFLDATDPDNVQTAQYALPNSGSEPYDIVYTNGFVWFTEKSGNRIGRLNVSNGQIDEFTGLTANSEPTGIDVAPDGRIWFLEQNANQLAELDPGTGTVVEHLYTPSFGQLHGELEDVAVLNNDIIWFSARDRNEIVRYEVGTGQFIPFSTRPPNSSTAFAEPIGMALDNAGTPWTVSFADSYIGRFVGGTVALFRWSPTPSSNAGPAQLAFYDAGQRWFFFYSEYNIGRVAWLSALTNSGVVGTVEYPLSSPDARPWGVDVDANGCAWFAATGINRIAEWCPPYAQRTWLPIIRGEALAR
jgi:streptogramin lyase